MSIRTSSALVTLAATLGLAVPASAAPILFARPGNRLAEVVNPDGLGAAVLGDSTDPNMLYVKPPAQGGTELTNVFFNANVGFCQELAYLQQTSFELVRLNTERMAELRRSDPEREALVAELRVLRADAAAKLVREVKDIRQLRFDVEDLTDLIDDLRERLLDCETDACEEDLQADIEEAKALRTELRADLRALERAHRVAVAAFEQAEALVAAKQTDIRELDAHRDDLAEAIAATAMQLKTMYFQYGQIEGGFGGIEFNSGWDAAIDVLRAANAGKGFSFQPLPTSDVRIFPQLIPGGADGYLAGQSGVMAYTLNGRQISLADTEQHLASFPSTMSSSVRLSLIGACPVMDPDRWRLVPGAGGTPLFGLHAGYSYPVAFRTRVTASFNRWRIYELIKRQTSRNGFFRSKTSISVEENIDEGTVWSFDFFNESEITSEEKKTIEDQLKAELMASVLQEMAVPSVGQAAGSLDPMPAPEYGALVFARGLDACGAWSPYCTVGAWALRGLHAVFGGASAETRFQQSNDRTITREYRSDAVQNTTGTTSFATR
jgi:hypothetical protein